MGNGMCSRRHKRIFQSLVLLTVVFGLLYGAMMSYEMHKQLKRTEAIAVKYQQHQESLSAQLQVVYEHRSRLEKSLQKERLEHKKAKEDFLVYKLEAQQSLNKDKQDSTSRFNSLNVQHEMLKNQHDELKKRYYGLHEEHQLLGEDHNRALTEHKDKYNNLQQEKEIEISKLKENIYNLHEENKYIRKAHQDVHTQLQDVKQQHQDLKSEHEQLAMTLDDHKSALAAAQAQVEEFKQFKETLKKMSSFRQPGLHTPVPEEPRKQGEDDQTQYKIHKGGHQPAGNVDSLHQQQEVPNIRDEREEREEADLDITHPSEHVVHREENLDRRWEGLQVQLVEEDHRKELAEEEMEQAGQPEHLDEESDQPREEEEKEGHQKEEQHHQPPAHAEQEEAGAIHKDDKNEIAKIHAVVVSPYTHGHGGSQQRLKSAYEEQLDQQRLVAQREEEARQLKERQESLHRQRLREQMDRQQHLRDMELQLQREADHKEQILRRQQQQQLRQQPEYENIDADIVQGAEQQDIQKQDDGHEHPRVEEGGHEQQDEDPEEEHAKKDANPQEDPNNQGEDEFEEAEKEKHNNLPDENAEHKKHPENMAKPEVDEQLVMAGNPDQQEDTLDEQYQEEGEEEVHDDLAEGPKEEENEEAYNEENEERGNIKDLEGPEKEEDSPPGDHLKPESEVIEEENYEEEVEEEEAPGNPNRRAEM
ncbi:Golgi integral membrane protein 4a isoform X1 [Acipenser oxyrinchus oxyrinchus]|uniref:Golgi integral membrane protein 4a isoform X1 n=1 Tax=Acipenser oxyrinchus oxyrinchus TaxID=40147 RepID=A0AAD8G010_ACIOX|nr:Golgi integral membrane protein 4a isoform X1 [Acipenser oxyrinchus oxyrinchus]